MGAAKVVLIEDNLGDVLLVELALKDNDIPYELTRFENGEEAVKAMCLPGGWAFDLHPDAILLDLNTPRSDGFEVLGKLRRQPHLAGVPMAIISSSKARTDKDRSALKGCVRYIEKPLQVDEFFSTVGQAVKDMLQSSGPG